MSKRDDDSHVSIEALKKDFDEFVENFALVLGQSISKKDREKDESPMYKSPDFIYHEIEFITIATAIDKIKRVYGVPNIGSSGLSGVLQHRGGLFYDLGCGTGKIVIAASLLHEFDSCIGIELLGSLIGVCSNLEKSYNSTKQNVSLAIAERLHETHCQFVFGDYLNIKNGGKNWTNGDVVFANSTSYTDETMEKLALIAKQMKKGSFFISISKILPTKSFNLVDYGMFPTSFGEATVYLQQKIHGDDVDYDDEDD